MGRLILTKLIISAIFYVALAAESNITKSMKEFKIIPNIIPEGVPELLEVNFDSGASVYMGNEILPAQAKNQPAIDWNADENSFYTLVYFDPDAPSPDDPFLSILINWLVGNIPGKDIDSGTVLAEYIPVSPPRGTNLHRAVFLLYKQPKKLDFDEQVIDKFSLDGRANFSLNAFSNKYDLCGPKAGNFYLTEFDSYVMKVYEQLNCCFEYNKPE